MSLLKSVGESRLQRSNMLKNIAEARLQSPFVLFVAHGNEPCTLRNIVCDSLHPFPDNAGSGGSSLFLSVVKTYIESSDRVTHVLSWQRATMRQLQPVAKKDPSKLILHDCLADCQGWINKDHQETGFSNIIMKSGVDKNTEINVVIDMLSNPLFTMGYGPCIQELQKMIYSSSGGGPKIHQILCLVHSEVLPCGSSSLSYLKHLATTVIDLKNHVAYTSHRKPGGHVERKEERYSLQPDGQLSIVPVPVISRVESWLNDRPVEEKQQTLPQDVASFRVSLSEKEKEDRDKLILPYMHTTKNLEETGGGGQVFYQPDAVDDWDDEDPDDDLDI